jgi:hypothetical protein
MMAIATEFSLPVFFGLHSLPTFECTTFQPQQYFHTPNPVFLSDYALTVKQQHTDLFFCDLDCIYSWFMQPFSVVERDGKLIHGTICKTVFMQFTPEYPLTWRAQQRWRKQHHMTRRQFSQYRPSAPTIFIATPILPPIVPNLVNVNMLAPVDVELFITNESFNRWQIKNVLDSSYWACVIDSFLPDQYIEIFQQHITPGRLQRVLQSKYYVFMRNRFGNVGWPHVRSLIVNFDHIMPVIPMNTLTTAFYRVFIRSHYNSETCRPIRPILESWSSVTILFKERESCARVSRYIKGRGEVVDTFVHRGCGPLGVSTD